MKVRQHTFIIGIDEVGRGALAGPVTVAVVCLPKNLIIKNSKLGVLKDSKKLSPVQRQKWNDYFFRHPNIGYNVARVYPRGIERLNISKAANRAASRAFVKLIESCGLKAGNCKIFLDGGLFLENRINPSTSSGRMIVRTIIRGDEKITAVKIASVIAKVNRDRYMERLSKKYPKYGFEIHKGYGTRFHIRAIRKYGLSKAHRLTFVVKSSRVIQKSNIKMSRPCRGSSMVKPSGQNDNVKCK